MGKAIGIDLGTTNSVAAFKEAQVEVVTSEENTPPDRKLTRSVVAYEQDKFLVGENAYNQLRHDPENAIVSIKRLMGRGFNEKAVEEQTSEVIYRITPPTQGTENGIAVWLKGKEYQPEDISAEILKKVVHNAQAYRQASGKSKEVIDQVVITIPAYFNDKQRSSTRTAALKAGLILQELLPEPTAAAISYGYSPDSEDVKTILVYDFGGGTFDASLITAAGTQFIENGKAGDLWLGGDNIDSQIIQFVKEQVAKQEGIADIDGLIAKMPHYQQVRFRGDLKMAVERAKIGLSRATSVQISPPALIDELGLTIQIEVELTREQFEAMILPTVERSIQICHEALRLSEYLPDMVDVVLLVGGSSQIPLVQRKVQQAFGTNKVVLHPRPMYAIAEGAAIVAAGLTDKITTVSRDYFIKLESEPRYKVISQGDILPVTTAHTFKTVGDGQRLIHFEFFSPDRVKEALDGVKGDERIGDMWLGLDRSYPQGTEVMVNLELDEKNSDLKITATLKNDPAVRVSCTFSRGRSDEKINQDLEQTIEELNAQRLSTYGVEEALKLAVPVVQATNQIIDGRTGEERGDMSDRAQANLQKLRVSMSWDRRLAEYLAYECEHLVQVCGILIPQPQQERLQKLKTQLDSAIESNNESAMQAVSEDADKELNNLPEEVQRVKVCFIAINRAVYVEPTQANAMTEKVFRMITALQRQDGNEADRLWRELYPDVNRWLSSDRTATKSIVTGLKR